MGNGGPYSTPSTDQEPYTSDLPLGAYELTFSDSYGDGICCSYGNGSYEATLKGVVVASGGEFQSTISHEFINAASPTSPPVSAPPTTVSPTSAASPSPQFWAVCPKSGECDEDAKISDSFEWHTVRCCSDEENLVGRKMMVVMSGVDLSLTGHAAYMKIILLLWAFVRQLEPDFAPKTS